MDQDDRELTPEQEARVRRLLADARHTEPAPEAVVARLDRVLADLADEPAREATVVRLADRRRRAATMLVAAAASVVAAVGIGAVLSDTGGGGGADRATSGEAEDAGAVPNAVEDAAPGPESQAGGRAAYRLSPRRMPLSVDAEEFAQDAAALQGQVAALSDFGSTGDQDGTASELDGAHLDRAKNRIVCEPGAWGAGNYVAVLYDGAEGWVVLRRPQGDTQVVDLFLCGGEAVVRSVTLPRQ